MATKKSASKKPAKKVSTKKASKKVGIPPPPPPPPPLDCIRRCYLEYRRCLSSGTRRIVCDVRYVQCIVRCTGVSSANIKTALK